MEINWASILMSVVTIIFGLSFVASINKQDTNSIISRGIGFLTSLIVLCLFLLTSYIERLLVIGR